MQTKSQKVLKNSKENNILLCFIKKIYKFTAADPGLPSPYSIPDHYSYQ